MHLRCGIMLAITLGLFSGCGGGQPGGLAEQLKDENNADHGLSVSEKLKRDLAVDPATAKLIGSAKKPRNR